MNNRMSSLVLIGLVLAAALTGACKNDGPSAPAVPTPASVSWSVTALAATSTTPLVNQSILVTATVTMDGQPAPDGTAVEFISDAPSTSYGFFSSANATSAEVETDSGSATAQFVALIDGVYTIQARVVDAVRQLSVSYSQPDQSDDLQIYRISPDEGPLAGSQMAFLTGKNIWPPIDVFFVVDNNRYHATTVDVGSDGATLTVTTPAVNDVDQAMEWTADVEVQSRVGLSDSQTYTLPSAYRFTPAISEPVIYVLNPNHGSARGGETVTIIGQNFLAPVQVRLGNLDAGQETVSPDGQQISFLTPQYSAAPINPNIVVDVEVTTQAGTAHARTVTKPEAWYWDNEVITPEITGIDPPAGPIDGGTVVTLFGSGFEIPMQVTFDDRVAVITSVQENKIVCVAPDMSTSGETPPFAVNVVASNLESGLTSNAVTYTYGENLYITGNHPSEGGRGTTIILYGSGFEDPLKVDFEDLAFEVVSVSGTEIVTKAPVDTQPSCDETANGEFTVTLIESGLTASGGNFTYYADNPRIYSVSPPIVTEQALPSTVTTPAALTINGNNFSETVLVSFDDYVLSQTDYTVVDESTITVQVPTPSELGLVFEENPCTTGGGLQGTRFIPTQVTVTVTNLPANCDDMLELGLTYEPVDTTCVARPNLVTSATDLVLPDWPFGSCSTPPTQLTILNSGSGDLNVSAISVSGPFNLVSPPTPAGAFVLAAGAGEVIAVDFCPPADGGLTSTGQIIIFSDDPTNPITYIGLTGTELAAPIITTSPYTTGGVPWTFLGTIPAGTCSSSEFLTITNSGDGPSTLTPSVVGQFSIVTAPTTPLDPSTNTTLELQFCPTAAGGQVGTLTITCDDTTNCPVSINLAGTGG